MMSHKTITLTSQYLTLRCYSAVIAQLSFSQFTYLLLLVRAGHDAGCEKTNQVFFTKKNVSFREGQKATLRIKVV
jgi:hypothetical protein